MNFDLLCLDKRPTVKEPIAGLRAIGAQIGEGTLLAGHDQTRFAHIEKGRRHVWLTEKNRGP